MCRLYSVSPCVQHRNSMTPQSRKKKAPITLSNNRLLHGKVVGFSGVFEGHTRETLGTKVSDLGGKVTTGPTPKLTHVISTAEARYKEPKPRLIKYALTQAIPIVKIEWLETCGSTGEYEFPQNAPKEADATNKKGGKDMKWKKKQDLAMVVPVRQGLESVVPEASMRDLTGHLNVGVMPQTPYATVFEAIIRHAIISLEMVKNWGARRLRGTVDPELMQKFEEELHAAQAGMCAE
jgi:hypothetical protein